MAIMEWFKVNGYNYMYGSLRMDTPIQRLVFVELLALASISRVRRTVCLSEGVPYPRLMLAGTVGITEDQLNEAISHHIKQDIARLRINEWGGIEIIKWDIYQSASYDRVRKHRERKKQCNADVTPINPDEINSYDNSEENVTDGNNSVTVEKRIEENRREEKRKEKKVIHPTLEEVKAYITNNPEIVGVDPIAFFKGFNDSGWIDTQGKPVRNWKLKLRTWSHFRKADGGTSSSAQQTSPPQRVGGVNPEEIIKKQMLETAEKELYANRS